MTGVALLPLTVAAAGSDAGGASAPAPDGVPGSTLIARTLCRGSCLVCRTQGITQIHNPNVYLFVPSERQAWKVNGLVLLMPKVELLPLEFSVGRLQKKLLVHFGCPIILNLRT